MRCDAKRVQYPHPAKPRLHIKRAVSAADRGHSADHGDCVRSGSCIDGSDQARSAVRTGGAVHLLAPLMTQ